MSYNKLLTAINWKAKLKDYLDNNYDSIIKRIKKIHGNNIIPTREEMFKPFNLCDLNDIYVVFIKGQPYTGSLDCFNDGLAYSMNNSYEKKDTNPLLIALDEIVRECYEGMPHKNSYNTDLSRWAKQGVFLYNLSLTGTNLRYIGDKVYWKEFSTIVLKTLNNCNPLTIIFNNKFEEEAWSKLFDRSKHNILTKEDFKNDNLIGISKNLKKTNIWLQTTYNKKIIW